MAIGTYAELAASISAWMLRATSDLVVTAAQIENYIQLTESELNRELRVRELEESVELPTVALQEYVTLPTDFKKVKDFYHSDAPFDLNMLATKGELKRKWSTAQGRPQDYAIFGTKIYLGKLPDAVYTLNLDYYKAITPLTALANTNAILTAYPDLYLYGALHHAYMQIKDKENGDMVTALYAGAVSRIMAADVESRMPAGLRMQTRGRLA